MAVTPASAHRGAMTTTMSPSDPQAAKRNVLAIVPLVAAALAVGAAFVVGRAVEAAALTSSTGEFAALGASLEGLFVGVLVGGGGYLMAIVAAAALLVRKGHRSSVISGYLGILPLAALLALLLGRSGSSPLPTLAAVAGVSFAVSFAISRRAELRVA